MILSLWKATKSLLQPHYIALFPDQNSCARGDVKKSDNFATHLANVFKPNDTDEPKDPEIELLLNSTWSCFPHYDSFLHAKWLEKYRKWTEKSAQVSTWSLQGHLRSVSFSSQCLSMSHSEFPTYLTSGKYRNFLRSVSFVGQLPGTRYNSPLTWRRFYQNYRLG